MRQHVHIPKRTNQLLFIMVFLSTGHTLLCAGLLGNTNFGNARCAQRSITLRSKRNAIETATPHPLSAVSEGSAPIQPVAHPGDFPWFSHKKLINSSRSMAWVKPCLIKVMMVPWHASEKPHFHQPITNWSNWDGCDGKPTPSQKSSEEQHLY